VAYFRCVVVCHTRLLFDFLPFPNRWAWRNFFLLYIYIYIKKKYIYIYIRIYIIIKITEHKYFHQPHFFKSVISVFCCSVPVGNISLHFQTFILPLIVRIQSDFYLHKKSDNSHCSTKRCYLTTISLSGMTWRNRTNHDIINPEELWQCLQDAKLPEKLCTNANRVNAALNA